MKTLIIATIPIVFAIVCYMLCILLQYIDYRKNDYQKKNIVNSVREFTQDIYS